MVGVFFEVNTPNGIIIRTTEAYWEKIVKLKHPSMLNEEEKVKLALTKPKEIRQSKRDKSILLYYKHFESFYVCVVVKVTRQEGFIVTAYKTDKVKEGKVIWQK